MANRSIIAYVLVVVIGFGGIISFPIVILSNGFTPYTLINDSPDPFIYTSQNFTEIHKLNLNVDVGNIDIEYTYDPVEYVAKIEVQFDISGKNVIGDNHTNYFEIKNDTISTNSSTLISFSMLLNPETDWFDDGSWIKRDVSIFVTLNADILFDLNITINLEGNVDLFVKGGININNVEVNARTPYFNKPSEIILDFEFCSIEGNITSSANEAEILLKTNNVRYTRNNVFTLSNYNGTLKIDIYQSYDMGGNITGLLNSTFGFVDIVYEDITDKVGA
ncbi:MAG: hypothetical protein ACW99L_09615, partial [Promethearchaeota archaeon]